jgi:hypothetical protein
MRGPCRMFIGNENGRLRISSTVSAREEFKTVEERVLDRVDFYGFNIT